jgi:hypothetical protein
MVALASSIGVALFPAAAAAQRVVDQRLWSNVTLQERSGTESPWRWASDLSLRTRSGLGELDVFVGRLTIGYDVSDHAVIAGGYFAAPTFLSGGGTSLEQRAFQQLQWAGAAGGVSLSTRTRLEQRFVDGNSGPGWRLRQQVRLSRPIATGRRFSLVASEEFFLHANETTRWERGFDQNRVFIGLGTTISPTVRLETGYLNQLQHARNAPGRMNHVLSATAIVAF